MKTKEESFGIVPLKDDEALIVLHRGGHWSFPKGHREEGESARQTAERELFEETGLRVTSYLDCEPVVENYTYQLDGQTRDKQVVYYLARVEGELKIDPKELEEGKWLPLAKVVEQMTFEEGRKICRQVIQHLELS